MAKDKKGTEKAKAAEAAGKKDTRELTPEEIEKHRKTVLSLMSYVLGLIAILLLVLFIADIAGSGAWFTIFPHFFKGLFSFAAFGTPFILFYIAYFLKKIIEDKKYKWNVILAVTLLITVSVIAGLILDRGSIYDPITAYKNGKSIAGGGIFGTYISWVFTKALSAVGAWILTIAVGLLQVVFLVGLSLSEVGRFFWELAKKLGRKIKSGVTALWRKITGKKPEKKKEKEKKTTDEYGLEVPERPAEGTKYYFKPVIDVELDEPADKGVKADKETKEGKASLFTDLDDGEAEYGLPKPEVIARPGAPEGWGEEGGRIKPAGATVEGSVEKIEEKSEEMPEEGVKEVSPAIVPLTDDEGEEGESGKETEIKARRRTLITAVGKGEESDEVEKKVYTFPPVSLLTAIPAVQTDMTEELQNNATRLVETLRSFKVPTRIVNISKGPTITRYELQPEEGVRVRQISGLVDDISLNLAASGVRIEAPIPGMSAVGVEVPNKQRETVYLRTLIDNDHFKKNESKLSAALGEDVAGEPIYVEISKMPHLLIAGTTGSGKSVCMNCLILSILYKATPDEVKMIMIDPKKVEFNVYNGLPHLIIPVVTDSKKAAGALAWAVSEMERRYSLIEQVGMRDIHNYNRVTANDPEKEFMPQLVVIIDELADLMLTAPGEVEQSICRIAQKGRASGIHLIIGTQRPSVDVITGLIKANVPSRIAFTVSSQVDSRTIIDIAGAEKLIGRGDMLFSPIGLTKPLRVQGAFVSDEEVERVSRFIKENSEEAVYDDKVIEDIEKEAALCGNKGKKGGAEPDISEEDGETDPMLRAAIDLAVESGKISTSLIQRRLSLGYGRAAKLIDEMERRGIVSPPEGQKPRSTLITAAEWHEMCMRGEGED